MQLPSRLVLASGNAGKLLELRDLLRPTGCEVEPISKYSSHSPEETGASFVENALIKARHACQCSGLAALADDSGIIVDALDAQPGVHSARYAGVDADDETNLQKLLEALRDVPAGQRSARFVSVVAVMRSPTDPLPVICEGVWEGRILPAPRGNGGFGYDPIFEVSGLGCSSAELKPEDKNRLSHRALALRELLARTGRV